MKTLRTAALRRFALAITVLNVLGHTVLGFEQPWAAVPIALLTAYGAEAGFELVKARGTGARPRFLRRRLVEVIDFFLPAHITGLACAMLLYANERLAPVAFAAGLAIASKHVVRVSFGGGRRSHFLNPSNTGIAVTLLLFPWVGIAPPYQFTAGLEGVLDWAFPGLLVVLGTTLNLKYTRRGPLVFAWLGAFSAQALLRSLVQGTPAAATLAPMTGLAFLLFTFYMVSDPATTPSDSRGQIIFGVAVAVVYGALQVAHVVFGLFFALLVTCVVRGAILAVRDLIAAAQQRPALALDAGLTGPRVAGFPAGWLRRRWGDPLPSEHAHTGSSTRV